MRICYAILADMAIRATDGKVSIIGVFNRLYAAGFPVVHERMAIVVAFEGGPELAGTTVEIRVGVLDPEAKELVFADIRLDIDPNELRPKGELICDWPPVRFDAPGDYIVRVTSPSAETYETGLELLNFRFAG